MNLAFREMGKGKPLIILHGLFGSGDNWQTLGKQFADYFHVYLIDQRNHGRSPHSAEMNYHLMADDLAVFIEEHSIRQPIILGHSMGGKTAMFFAQMYPQIASRLLIADMGIKAYPSHHDAILDVLTSIELDHAQSRGEVEKSMELLIPEFAIRQFLLKNLYWVEKGKLGWRMNVTAISEHMNRILEALPHQRIDTPTCFLRGIKSAYIIDEDIPTIRGVFPNAAFVDLDAGHWLHAEEPEAFYKAVLAFTV